jgi:ComEC/Rec2-related protein
MSRRFRPHWPFAIAMQAATPFLLTGMVGMGLAAATPSCPLWGWAPLLGLTLTFLGLAMASTRPNILRGALFLVMLVAGGVYFEARHFQPNATELASQLPLQEARLSGTVFPGGKSGRYVLHLSSLNGEEAAGDAMLWRLPKTFEPLAPGTPVKLVANLRLPRPALLPGGFDEAAYLGSQHIGAVLERVQSIRALSEQPKDFRGWLERLLAQTRNRLGEMFTNALGPNAGPLLGGIVLGDQAIPLADETRQHFQATGLIHLVAASGMNVGIIAGFLTWLLRAFRLPRGTRFGVTMAGVAVYALLTGLPPSILRAGLMLELALALKWLNRDLDGLSLFTIAVAVLLLANPDAVGSLSFQFSVLTTFGLLAMMPRLGHWLDESVPKFLSVPILVPIVAQLWILPLSWKVFNRLPLHTVPLNIFAGMLVVPATVLGFISAGVGLMLTSVGQAISWLAAPFTFGLLWLADFGNTQQWAMLSLPSPSPWQVLMAYVLLGLGLLVLSRPRLLMPTRWACVALGVILAAIFPLAWEQLNERPTTRVEILPLSERRAALLVYPSGRTAPIAVVRPDLAWYEAKSLAQYLRHTGHERLAGWLWLPAENLTAPPPTLPKGVSSRFTHAIQTGTDFSLADEPAFRIWTSPDQRLIRLEGGGRRDCMVWSYGQARLGCPVSIIAAEQRFDADQIRLAGTPAPFTWTRVSLQGGKLVVSSGLEGR